MCMVGTDAIYWPGGCRRHADIALRVPHLHALDAHTHIHGDGDQYAHIHGHPHSHSHGQQYTDFYPRATTGH